jgi:hypothetical protein
MKEREYQPQQPNPGEQPALPAERREQFPRAKPQDQEGSNEPTHEELVRELRDYLRQREQELVAAGITPQMRGYYLPEELIHRELARHMDKYTAPYDEQRVVVFGTLLNAWNALAYERYVPGSAIESTVGNSLEVASLGGETTIKLTDPVQVRIIDALTEIAGIPHQRGQSDIEIPDKLRHYHTYALSQEYKDRVAQANVPRERRR